MSLDKLAVIFIIIILPISLALNVYTEYQTKTLNLQTEYDTKLNNATLDALKAYQLNAFNESTSDLSASKMRDIDAAANAFFNSVSANFNMTGYDKETIQSYVPALVFTMYDGFYIYSKFENTLSEDEYSEGGRDSLTNEEIKPSTYQNGDMYYGIQPFNSYSCRYKRGSGVNQEDFVISYTLDNYISIQGKIKNQKTGDVEWVNDAGYLIDTSEITYNPQQATITYRGVEIVKEGVTSEVVGKDKYPCQKINGVKYYYDEKHKVGEQLEPAWFSIINGDKAYIPNSHYNMINNFSAFNYYKDAYEFTKRVQETYGLSNLKVEDAYSVIEKKEENNGNVTYIYETKSIASDLSQNKNEKIFGTTTFAEGIEEPSSNFNQHRLAVIKYVIEKNLSVAIKNYNHYSNVDADFQMPKLKETEWDKILNNITLISFLQGMPIGGKLYNGCCVVANNKNDEVVTEQSIYIGVNKPGEDNYYYNPLYRNFREKISGDGSLVGLFNVDLERRSIESGDISVEEDYYYPKLYFASYDSIVNPTANANISAEKDKPTDGSYAYNGNIYKYMEYIINNDDSTRTGKKVATAYFTALGRERYSTYKINAPYKIPADTVRNSGNSHKYKMFKCSDVFKDENGYDINLVTWDAAEAYCESLGGYLATITNRNEENFIESNFYNVDAFLIGYYENDEWFTGEKNETSYSYSGNGIPNSINNGYQYFLCEWD